MEKSDLFRPYILGSIALKNHIVMSPMTRSRAIGNIPNDLIASYYGQRAEAGLIITEGTSPSPNGLGYTRIPGIFSKEQVEAWKKVTHEVKTKGGAIFIQLMHTGRIGHAANLPGNALLLAPSAIKANGKIWTDSQGLQEYPVPKAMNEKELQLAKNEFITAAKNAIQAGFDGIELHGANGYLLEQFISPMTNHRIDSYGGSIENRCRFVLEVAETVAGIIGKDKTAIRLSPYGVANDMPHYPEIDATYIYLAEQLEKIGLVYIHLVDHSSMGAPPVPVSIKKAIREKFQNTLILAGGNTKQTAENILASKSGDLVAFGKPFISNPDLVHRLANNLPLNMNWDMKTFYSADEKGYTDYEAYKG